MGPQRSFGIFRGIQMQLLVWFLLTTIPGKATGGSLGKALEDVMVRFPMCSRVVDCLWNIYGLL